MGNDGGSILKRADMVKMVQQEIKVSEDIVMKSRSKLCSISKSRLRKPIAACKLGFLFNYDVILKCLMEKNLPDSFKYIRKLKDIKKLTFTENENINSEQIIVCPIIMKEFNGLVRFQFNWKCGCIVSEQAQKTMDEQKCVQCGEVIDEIISLNKNQEEQQQDKNRILDDQIKQSKKQQKQPVEEKAPKKKVKQDITLTILDKISQDYDRTASFLLNQDYKGMFHKADELNKTEDANNLFFRNVRNGIR